MNLEISITISLSAAMEKCPVVSADLVRVAYTEII